ncbi:hypothetical protein OAT46_05855 [Gammaproteobacteria bacterium]|nr:hypothetical protein [Gammaproteobacteria bacterium]
MKRIFILLASLFFLGSPVSALGEEKRKQISLVCQYQTYSNGMFSFIVDLEAMKVSWVDQSALTKVMPIIELTEGHIGFIGKAERIHMGKDDYRTVKIFFRIQRLSGGMQLWYWDQSVEPAKWEELSRYGFCEHRRLL